MDNASVYGTEDCSMWPRGAMDNASVYGTEDCRFESCRGRGEHYTSTSIAVICCGTNIRSRKHILVFVGNDSEFLAQPETVCDPKIAKQRETVCGGGAMDNASVYGTEDCRFELPWSCEHYTSTACCDMNVWDESPPKSILFSLATIQNSLSTGNRFYPEHYVPKTLKMRTDVAAWRNGQRVGLRNRRLQVRILPWSCWNIIKVQACCDNAVGDELSTLEDIFLFSLATFRIPYSTGTLCDRKSLKNEEHVAAWRNGQRVGHGTKIAGSNPAVVVVNIIQAQALL
uniref:Uncharacterized protein n=1 Tax=Parascaris univalens TaxID=6257 RepID=A0A915CKI6_PARUN